ncbi:MAG: amino acid permease, partial [Chlamydiia bacterium]|nr:amino acid permease [Chlamydiia bacterium]
FPARGEGNAEGLGTFSGVYLPSVLQMLGVILFMRLGWITGHIGLPMMTLIIFMSSSILFLTSLSMTSIVTNMKVGSGGSYYIISRSLGMAFGSAIGILLTVSQLVSIAISISGFALSVQALLPQLPLSLAEICALVGLATIALFPANFALKMQGIIFCAVLGAILSIFWGSSSALPEGIPLSSSLETLTFWGAFALFFPATTGIESGMAMSGDLKNPSRSLAIGTMGAVVTAYLVYIALSTFLSMKIPSEVLKSHPMVIYYVSKVGLFFIAGVWGATLSSALGSLMTSPRTIQSLAKDHVLPHFFAKQLKYPVIVVVLLTATLLLTTDINHLLPILSMVCLMTYGLLNFVAFFETLIQNPSFRPLFRTPMAVSLTGTLACLVSMFMINAGWAFTMLVAVTALGLWMAKRKLQGNWDDLRYSLFSFFASTATNKLVHLKKNPRSWRPNILAIIDPELQEKAIIHFSHALNQAKGFLTFGVTLPDTEKLKVTQTTLEEYFRREEIPCFFHLNAQANSFLGTHHIVQNYGMGPLQPNTIILRAPTEKFDNFCSLIQGSYELQKNLLIMKTSPSFIQNEKQKQIDLWWGGQVHANFELSLALSHILQSGKMWSDASINIKTLVPTKAALLRMEKLFEKYSAALRIKNLYFKPFIDETTDFYSHIATYSTDAHLTFLGLRAPESGESLENYTSYFQTLLQKTEGIANIAYVLAGEKLDFQRILE